MLGHKTMKKETLKYSASKLYNKGILLAIDGLPENQFKNVLFEIVPTNTDCVFEIHAKFMGVRMESVDVNVQVCLCIYFSSMRFHEFLEFFFRICYSSNMRESLS